MSRCSLLVSRPLLHRLYHDHSPRRPQWKRPPKGGGSYEGNNTATAPNRSAFIRFPRRTTSTSLPARISRRRSGSGRQLPHARPGLGVGAADRRADAHRDASSGALRTDGRRPATGRRRTGHSFAPGRRAARATAQASPSVTAARAEDVPPLVQQVLDVLPEARPSGTGWTARCPAHDDRSPSLVVNVGDDGYRPVVECHGPCEYADVRAALIAAGAPEAALRPAGPRPPRPAPAARWLPRWRRRQRTRPRSGTSARPPPRSPPRSKP